MRCGRHKSEIQINKKMRFTVNKKCKVKTKIKKKKSEVFSDFCFQFFLRGQPDKAADKFSF